jgi:FMN phosphatase YigB (HAD superfamily)
VTLFFFDFDKTLYAYDFHIRLPALSLVTGASQYQLAKTWWAGGYEIRAEEGEWRECVDYLAEFTRVTGAHLTLENWQETRALASTAIPGSVAALAHAATLGSVCVLSNNPSPFAASLTLLAPDVAAIVGDNRLVSCDLGTRKPDPAIFRLALDRMGATAEETFFTDDSAANIAGAQSIGITGHHLTYVDGVPQVDALRAAIDRFAG